MDDLPVLKVITARSGGDCAVCCLAMVLGCEYEDILSYATKLTGSDDIHYKGMWITQIINIAKGLGVKLRKRKKFDLESGCGILSLTNQRTKEGHVAVLKRGMVFDVDGTVWEHECFFKNTRYMVDYLLTLS
jgi:hypothetical protein